MREFQIGDRATVTFHPYRTIRVFGTYIDIDRDSDIGKKLEEDLIQKSGRTYGDNHCGFTIQEENEAPLYVWITDDLIRIGTKLLKESW